MKFLFTSAILTLISLSFAACGGSSSQDPTPLSSFGSGESSGSNSAGGAGVTLQGGDHGREGGHFLICSAGAGIPDSRMEFEVKGSSGHDKAIFIDYFLEIQSNEKRDALEFFSENETDSVRLDRVAKRLLALFANNPDMKQKAQRMVTYASSFMQRKGAAQWIESTDMPFEFELTEDVTPEQLADEQQQIINDNCQGRLFQAAVYDYSEPGREVFYYSEFFENHASLMQKSFRNVHEMLRFIVQNETPQVVKLTAYFHTQAFFNDDAEMVRQQIASIVDQAQQSTRFY